MKALTLYRYTKLVPIILLLALALTTYLCVRFSSVNHALLEATKEGNSREITKLLDAGANPNATESIPLMTYIAAYNAGTSMRIISPTPLILALDTRYTRYSDMPTVPQENVELLTILLRKGANPNVFNSNRESPLLLATIWNKTASIKLLLKFGANVNFQDQSGRTPLTVAVHQGNHNIVYLFICNHANTNIQDKNGNTPLIEAVSNNNISICKLLIRAGGDARLKNKQGLNAMDYALLSHNKAIIKLIFK